MGMADFYLKINFKKQNYNEFETIYKSFINESIFRFLDNLNVEEVALIQDVDAIKQELLSVSNSLDTINGEVI